jgi:hypothetical protein
MSRSSERTAYCRKQAAECAAAATATALAEVKEAYLNLEQGWLQLAPEIEPPNPFSLHCPGEQRGQRPTIRRGSLNHVPFQCSSEKQSLRS